MKVVKWFLTIRNKELIHASIDNIILCNKDVIILNDILVHDPKFSYITSNRILCEACDQLIQQYYEDW